ncbi:MAG: Ig-like domain-containing protein [Cyclobacteriaceae bacterium]|jgi:uncharacterized protein (DUF2141 family)|nr:Ig-like domain-containing protein [Cyclobacteriaceae bacterium]
MKYLYNLLIIVCFGCASQTTPTGGPKDETPPKLISTSPKPETTNFKDNTIELNFDELIQLEKPKEQIIISPLIKEVEYNYRKNKVFLKFNEKLKDSTTYTINFRDAVKDLTEKNPAQDVKLAFSTGPVIDTLTISGLVFDLLQGKTIDNVTVALQPASDTFNMFKHKARIITKSNAKTGEFIFTNIKSGNYLIYAFTDKNNNLLVESQNEMYAYLKNPINLNNNVVNIVLPLIKVDNRGIKVISMRSLQNYFTIKLNKSAEKVNIKTEKQNLTITAQSNQSEFKIYDNSNSDSTLVNLTFTDTIHQRIDTTFYAKFNHQYETKRLDKIKVETSKVNVFAKNNLLTNYIAINKPIKRILFDSLYIHYDSISRETVTIKDLKIDTLKNLIYFNKTLNKIQTIELDKTTKPKNKVKATFTFGKGSIISVDQDTIPNKRIELTIFKEEDLAKIYIEPLQEDEYAELLSDKNEVIQTIYGKQSTVFENVLPGEYKIRLVKDLNKNRKWDAAIPTLQEEAEPIYFYFDDNMKQTFSVKSNWDYGPLLIKPEFRVENMGKDKNKNGSTNRK